MTRAVHRPILAQQTASSRQQRVAVLCVLAVRREQALDRLRWQLVDEMQGVQPISENVVLAYAVKLRLALRLQSLDETAGRAKFDELTH